MKNNEIKTFNNSFQDFLTAIRKGETMVGKSVTPESVYRDYENWCDYHGFPVETQEEAMERINKGCTDFYRVPSTVKSIVVEIKPCKELFK